MKAIEIAVAVETANKDAIELQGKSNLERSVNRLHRQRVPSAKAQILKPTEKPKYTRYRCNCTNPKADSWKFIGATCHGYSIKGHISRPCRSKVKWTQKLQKKFHPLDNEKLSDDDDLGVYSMKNEFVHESIWITPNVNEKEIKMELDTGACVSGISMSDYEKYFRNEKLEKAKIKLKTYYVVQNGGPALFGRVRLKKINLEWKNLKWIKKLSVYGNTVIN